MKKMKLLLGCFCSLIALNAFAISSSLPADRLRDIQELDKQADEASETGIKIEKIKNTLEQYALKRDLNCQFAFGNQKFCECLNHKLPMIVDFYQYIGIITSDKMVLLSKLNEKDKKIVNMVFEARDVCASEMR